MDIAGGYDGIPIYLQSDNHLFINISSSKNNIFLDLIAKQIA